MFDFVSPFDALLSGASPQSKKNSVPQLPPVERSGAIGEPWIAASVAASPDPKRQSVEHLMEQLTRGQVPQQQAPPPQHQPAYDSYASEDFTQNELIQPRGGIQFPQLSAPAPPPPPPQQARVPSPRASPPKLPVQSQQQQQQQRPQPRAGESPIGQPAQQQAPGSNRREKESSPIPRGNWKTDVKGKGPAAKGKVAYVPLLNSHDRRAHCLLQRPLSNYHLRCVAAAGRDTGITE